VTFSLEKDLPIFEKAFLSHCFRGIRSMKDVIMERKEQPKE
jgi:hypothetical protein